MSFVDKKDAGLRLLHNDNFSQMIRNFAAHKVLGVLRSTYYHYALRRPEQTMIEKEDELFRPIIRKIFEDTQGRLGAKKIRAHHDNSGVYY